MAVSKAVKETKKNIANYFLWEAERELERANLEFDHQVRSFTAAERNLAQAKLRVQAVKSLIKEGSGD